MPNPDIDMSQAFAPIRPVAGYSPWLADAQFLSIYEQIKGNTLVDIYRLYELFALVRQLSKIPPGDILEVGVWRGGSGALLAWAAREYGLPCKVYLADTFQGVVKAGKQDTKYTGGEHADTSLDMVQELLERQLGLANYEILPGIFPDETAGPLEQRVFSLCHIDVDVYASARDINEWVWQRLVPGGVVIYDDYGFEPCVGVTRYVNEQCELDDRMVIHNLNGHALVFKLR